MDKKQIYLNPDKFRGVIFDNLASEDVGYSNYSYWKSTFRTFFKSKLVCFLVALVAAIILMSFLYPVFSDTDPTKVSLMFLDWNQKPSAEHCPRDLPPACPSLYKGAAPRTAPVGHPWTRAVFH